MAKLPDAVELVEELVKCCCEQSKLVLKRKLSRADLARLMNRSPQYVSQLLASKKVTPHSARAVAAALQLPLKSLHPRVGRGKTSLDKCRARLDLQRIDLGASSCTLYVRDPHWVDEFVLVAMSNGRYPEPMYGVLSPASARSIVLKGDRTLFVTNTLQDAFLSQSSIPLDEIPEATRHLFGSFVQRERVQSTARLIHVDQSESPEAVLFINYPEPTIFDEPLKRRLLDVLEDLLSDIAAIRHELAVDYDDWLVEATRILSPTWSVANIDFSMGGPDQYFKRILEATLHAFGGAPETAIGTLHLYNPEDQTLQLHASCGPILYPERTVVQSVRQGQGVVSWVVIRARALLISDLASSEFNEIHVWLNDDIKSELAVPLQVGGEVIGCMCLESTEANHFQPHHVQSAWYASNRAAIAYHLHQQISMNRDLLEICSKASAGATAASTSLNGIAKLACKCLRASFCDIAGSNPRQKSVSLAGASFDNFTPLNRPDGFTDYLRQWPYPILLTDIASSTNYRIRYWKLDAWYEGPPSDYATRTQPRDL